MNKDVIYVEPENDITDIITKIENSPEKIVVLVPPKKAAVFRSVVNIKLIARAGRTAEKTVVLVTVDPSIIKLAAAARIPVTKDLKTPPEVPTVEKEPDEMVEEEIIEEDEPSDEEEIEEKPEEKPEEEAKEEKKAEKKSKKDQKPEKVKGGKFAKVTDWVKGHKAVSTIGGVVVIALVGFLVWAINFAPAVTVAVEIQTEAKSFAENVGFTTTATDEDAKEGIFYIQEKTETSTQEIKFDATGKVNKGEKASGNITVSQVFDEAGQSVTIPEGTTFSTAGLSFATTQSASLAYPTKMSELNSKCENDYREDDYCRVSVTIPVTATEPGSQYNIGATSQWSTSANVSGVSSTAMNGGSDKEIKIVEQIDVENAKNQVKASNEEEIKKKLMNSVGNNMMAIESSYSIETGNAESSPAVGQEVADGAQAMLKVVTTAKIYAIDKSKLEEFIDEKAQIPDDQKVYQIDDPYIESFAGGNGSFSGRLKASYRVGPKVTDSEVVDRIKGKGLGEAQHELKGITGVINVTIDTSYPWVMSVPGDANKITVNIDVKEAGNKNTDSDKKAAEDAEE